MRVLGLRAASIGAFALVLQSGRVLAGDAPSSTAVAGEQTLTGEVVPVWHRFTGGDSVCCVFDPSSVQAIRLGSPVAIKVGPSLYVVSKEDRVTKNQLMRWAGRRVTVQGAVIGGRRQAYIRVSHVERAR